MEMKWNALCIVRGLVYALAMAASLAQAAEIKVIAANAVKGSVQAVTFHFEKTSGHNVTTIWGGTEAIARKIRNGEVFDVVIVAAPAIDELTQEGKIVQGSRTDFARSGVGVAVRTGLPRPDISSAQALRQAVLNANSVAYSSGPSGYYLADLFRKLGIADQIRDKVRQPGSGVQVGEIIARGEADLGFQQISELMHVKGIDYLGPLPAEIQHMTVYAAGLHSEASAPDAARALMRLLTAPESASVIRKTGMEPP
jgi:molybdate transport system substrate-binding protein